MSVRLPSAHAIEITRYRYGLRPTRPVGVPRITATSYGYMLVRWRRFDEWNAWLDAGRPQPRPSTLWKNVAAVQWEPNWGPFQLREEIVRARSKVPPPVPVPPVPPLPASSALWQSCAWMGENPLDALQGPRGIKVGVTADPGYDQYALRSSADVIRGAGDDVFVWFVPTEVSYERALSVAQRLGVPRERIAGQGESAAQMQRSLDLGLAAAILNLSDLTDPQLEAIRAGRIAASLEHYWNLQPGLDIDFKNCPVASITAAVYDGHDERQGALPAGWHPSLATYIATPTQTGKNRFPAGSSVYGPGMTSEDWAAWKAHGL